MARMTQSEFDENGCDQCDPFGDSSCCVCDPEPLEDFENGYCDELTGFCGEPLTWYERANANPLNMDLFLRCRYGQPFTATFENGMKRAIERMTTIEDIAMRDRPMLSMLKDRAFMAGRGSKTPWFMHEKQTEFYGGRDLVVSSKQYDDLAADLGYVVERRAVDFGSGPVLQGVAADGRWNFVHSHVGNRHERRKAKALSRRRS